MARIICVGDSIRMGYEAFVVRELTGWGEVVEMGGIQGGNTRKVLEHLEKWVIQHDLDIVHLNAGLHDLARDVGPGPETRVPLEEYRENLRKILSSLQEKTDARVIFALTTPVDLARQQAYNYGINRINEDVIAFNRAATEVAGELGVPLDDLYQVVVENGVANMLKIDGVHFTEEGSAILGKAVARAIRAAGEDS